MKALADSDMQLHKVEQVAENMELEMAVLRNQVEHMLDQLRNTCRWSV